MWHSMAVKNDNPDKHICHQNQHKTADRRVHEREQKKCEQAKEMHTDKSVQLGLFAMFATLDYQSNTV